MPIESRIGGRTRSTDGSSRALRIAVVPSDVVSCEKYRAAFAVEHLAREGEVEHVELPRTLFEEHIKVRYAVRRHGAEQLEPVAVTNPPDVDVLVFTRGVLSKRMVQTIPLFQRHGIAVVVDFDDDYKHLPHGLKKRYQLQPDHNPAYNWTWAERAAQLADLVTVSTPALVRYRRDAVVLRNVVPERYTRIERSARRGQLTVGWPGTVAGHPGDLRVPGAGVVQALRSAQARFLVVGHGEDVLEQLGLDDIPDTTGIVEFDDYPEAIARLDVGIAPLHSSAYTVAKSALKPLEELSLGVPCVFSPTDEYRRLYDQLAQWCASQNLPVPAGLAGPRAREWRRELGRLLSASEDERETMSDTARRFVLERGLTVERSAWLWYEAYTHALVKRRYAQQVASATVVRGPAKLGLVAS